jgi:predicted RNA binding protein YcfA (HicA-like mRNA interferase family)
VADFAPLVKQELLRVGWERKRFGKGDHAIWWNPKSGETVTVDSKIKSRHTANLILKRAGVSKKV